MKIINKASSNIKKLWLENKIKLSVYRIMTYVVNTDVNDRKLLHNCFTGELIYLDKKSQVI